MRWRKNKLVQTLRLCGMIQPLDNSDFLFLVEFSNKFPLQPAMGRKRKAGSQSSTHVEPADLSQEKALLRINTYEDVADSEDEFFDNQDKILLAEGPAQKRQRKAQEDGIKRFSGMSYCTNN